ncbi:MAG: hypothetical protein RR700_01525 [Anaerorhabdus sp.]|uniref:hypothetical protein n=1 Tax=Anaerorhabdus sp. TaxID=1872524 RepID=UPI002FCB90AC
MTKVEFISVVFRFLLQVHQSPNPSSNSGGVQSFVEVGFFFYCIKLSNGCSVGCALLKTCFICFQEDAKY